MSTIKNTTIEAALREDLTRDVFISSLKDVITAKHTSDDFGKKWGTIRIACGLFDLFLDTEEGEDLMTGLSFKFKNGKSNRKRYIISILGSERAYGTFHQNVLDYKKSLLPPPPAVTEDKEDNEEGEEGTVKTAGCQACTAKDELIVKLTSENANLKMQIAGLQSELVKVKTTKGTTKKDTAGKASLRA